MSALEGLTALEREQLRYIVERVQEWPEGHGSIWVTSVGWIAGSNPSEEGYLFERRGWDYPAWPTYSPDFTRAQYDAMKAEMDSPDICAACKRSHDAGTTCCPDCIRRLEAECDRVAAEHAGGADATTV